jgi:dTDP-4-amino-4,6-dideoxygalactose transaminase
MWKVQLFELNFDSREAQAAADVIESRWITMGERTREFEAEFSGMLGGDVSCAAVSSCTAALHLALLSCDVGQGDEVIIPALTFVADINVVEMVGATAVLADCESEANWNVSATTIAQCITEKTKAVIVVHFAGYPCDMDEIVSLCKKHNIRLIEDVAHAPGAMYKGRACGTFGDFGCFSFFTNKNLSIGEGGMLSTSSKVLDQKARYFRAHGMTSLTLDRFKGRAISYDVAQPGLNYRIDEIRSAIGLVQLDKLAEGNQQRKAIVERYVDLLKDQKGLQTPFVDFPDCDPSYHIFIVLLSDSVDRVEVINSMKEDGVQTSIHYPSFRAFSAYKDRAFGPTPVADLVSERVLTLPLYPTMTFEQVDLVVDSLKKALG